MNLLTPRILEFQRLLYSEELPFNCEVNEEYVLKILEECSFDELKFLQNSVIQWIKLQRGLNDRIPPSAALQKIIVLMEGINDNK